MYWEQRESLFLASEVEVWSVFFVSSMSGILTPDPTEKMG